MSHWERLLCAEPETITSWPPGFATPTAIPVALNVPLSTNRRASVPLPSVASRRRSSLSRRGAASVGGASLKTRSWSGSKSVWPRGRQSRGSTPESPGNRTCNTTADEDVVGHCVTVSGWRGRHTAASRSTPEWNDECQRKLSREGVVLDSLAKGSALACDAVELCRTVENMSPTHQAQVEVDAEEGLEGPEGVGNVCSYLNINHREAGGANPAHRTSFRSDVSSPSRALETTEYADESEYLIATPSQSSDGRRDLTSSGTSSAFRRGAAHTLSFYTPGAGSKTSIISTIDGAASPPPDLDEGKDGVAQAVGEESENFVFPGGQWRNSDAVAVDLARSVSSSRDFASSGTGRPKAFHNFVFRRKRREGPKRSASLGELSVSDSTNGASWGDADSSVVTCGYGGSKDEYGNSGVKRSLRVGQSRERSSAPGQTEQWCATSGTGSDALSVLSSGGSRKLGCCGGDRPLKCQRCGSARVKLFAPLPAVGPTASGIRRTPGCDGALGNTRPSLEPMAPYNGSTGRGMPRRRVDDRTLSPFRWGESGSIGRGTTVGLLATSPEAAPVGSGGSGGDGDAWKKGWRYRGENKLCQPAQSGVSLLVPARRS